MDLMTPLRSVVSTCGLELYDVEMHGGTLEVIVTRPGGVDLDALTAANRAVSTWLDENDPIEGHYTLDVSSPGLERRLRNIEHFAGAVGERVTLREVREGEATRRLEGTLVGVEGTTLRLNDESLGEVAIDVANVERARTVFTWGSNSPSGARTQAAKKQKGK